MRYILYRALLLIHPQVWLYFKAATLVIRTPKADVMMAHLQQIHRYCFPASPLKVEVSPPSKCVRRLSLRFSAPDGYFRIAEIPELGARACRSPF